MNETRYAVVIGNSTFPEDPKLLPELRCPTKDASTLHSVLSSAKYGGYESALLENKLSYEILTTIEETLNRAQKNDLVLIYYSGHGKLGTTGALHLAARNSKVNLLQSTSISVTQLRDLMNASSAHKLILILDCCYSGQVEGAFLKGGGAEDRLQEVSSNSRGIYILTASTGVQVAQEKEGDDYSLLTKHLLEGIREGKADFDDDGKVTITDLYNFASKSMRKESFQVPMKWDLSVQGDTLVVARTGMTKGARRESEVEELLYYRRRFREKYIIGGLTAGGALGAGLSLFFLRLPLVLLLLSTDQFIVTIVFSFLIYGLILGGAISLGIALGTHLWKLSEAEEAKRSAFGWIRSLRNSAIVPFLLGTLLFVIAYLLISVVNGMKLSWEQVGASTLVALILGCGLSAALYRQPTIGLSIGARGWIVRFLIIAATFTCTFWFRWKTIPILTLDPDYYSPLFSISKFGWLRRVADHPAWLAYVELADACLVGVLMTIGLMVGLTKATDALTQWAAKIQPDRE